MSEQKWLKAEEATENGVYWMVFANRKPKLVECNDDSFRFLDTNKHMNFMIPNTALFHGPLTPPPLL